MHASDVKPLANLVLMQPSAVIFTLPASDVDEVRGALHRGPVEVMAFDQDNKTALSTGTLLLIDNAIDPATATIRLKAMFANVDDVLWPGEFVNARVLVETRHDAITVPNTAIQSGPKGLFAWVVASDDTVAAASHRGRTRRRRFDHRHRRLGGWRSRCHRRTIQVAAENQGRDYRWRTGRRRADGSQVNISEPFIRRPIATSLLMAAVALLGVAAFLRLPVAPLPQVDFPTIQVTATLAGASAETMASSVATPLERQLGQIPGVTEMTSFSALGATSVTVQFDLSRNIDLAAQDVQAAITAAGKTLPQTMTTPPTYKKLNPADAPILVLAARSDTLPLTQVDEYADSYLAQQISQVLGVAQVAIGGEQRPSIRVQVDPAKLAARGLTLEQVRGALVTATTDAPKGSLTTAKTSFTIDANDQITDAKQFDDVVVSYNNGAPVRVRDVGRAIAAASDRFSAAYDNNKPAILLSIYKQPGRTLSTPSSASRHCCRRSPRDSAGGQGRYRTRPHYDDPRFGHRRRVHADPDSLSRRSRRSFVSARHMGDFGAGPHHRSIAVRRVCGDVCV